jgi:uncharacterized protein YllA (UPF0747 family)
VEAKDGFDSAGFVEPILWPAISATIIDARRRKILKKYALTLPDLLKGEEAVLKNLRKEIRHSSIKAELGSMKSEMERHIEDLKGPGMEGKSFRKARERCLQRIAYQLDKIMDRTERAGQEKLEVMQRRVRRACGFLAPDGMRQEDGLNGVSFPLRHSGTIFTFLYENLDIMKFEHQLVYLD